MSMTGRVYSVGSDNRYFAVFDMAGLSDIKARHSTLMRLAGNLLMGTWLEHQTDGALDSGWITSALKIDQKVPKTNGAYRILPNVGTVIFTLNIAGDPGSPLIPPEMPKLDFTFDPHGEPGGHIVAPLVSTEGLAEAEGDSDDTTAAWQVMATRTSACPGTGEGMVVAMVDTGVRTTHVEFDGALVVRGPRYDADGNITEAIHTDDPHGHGTRMASAVVGRRCGVAPDATLFMVAGLDENKSTRLLGLLVAIDDAADGPNRVPVDVLSLSLEMAPGSLDPGTIADIGLALQNVAANGTLVLSAAGNNGDPSNDECASPLAGLGGSVAVGACARDGDVNGMSGWSASRSLPDLYAYADDVLVPLRLDNTSYTTYAGQSSYATAFTAGVSACIIGREPGLRRESAPTRDRLLALARPATDPDARPVGAPAGIARICGDSQPVLRETETVDTHHSSPCATTPSTAVDDSASTPPQEQLMSEKTDTPIGPNPVAEGAEADEGTWIVYSVDEATGKCASIIGYLWSQKYDTAKYHEYFIFDDNVFNPDYEKLPFVKTLTFWRMTAQPTIATKGDFEVWVKSSAPHKIPSADQVKRYANTEVNSAGWPP